MQQQFVEEFDLFKKCYQKSIDGTNLNYLY